VIFIKDVGRERISLNYDRLPLAAFCTCGWTATGFYETQPLDAIASIRVHARQHGAPCASRGVLTIPCLQEMP
jgi:hypothetical protein